MLVIPVMGEIGRYRVESRSKRDTPEHTVDIISDECGCRDWICNHTAKGPHYRCAHIIAAREYALNDYIEIMKEHALTR